MRKHDGEDSDAAGSTASSSTSSDGGEEEERRRAANIDVQYASSTASAPKDLGATARLEIDTAADNDYQAQFERVQAALKDQPGSSGAGQKVSG